MNIEKYLEIPHRETITSYNTLQTKPFDYQKTENMNNKKQTAIEWLLEQLEEKGDLRETKSIGNIQLNFDVSEYIELKKQAKEMEKEQIMKSYSDALAIGIENGKKGVSFFEVANCVKYYNENYGE